MNFDATDLEIARREHAYEMGEESLSEKAWYRFCDVVEAGLEERGLGDDLDGDDDTDGFSLDMAHDAFRRGDTPQAYLVEVELKRANMGERS